MAVEAINFNRISRMSTPSRRRPRKIDRRLLPVVAGGAEALIPLEPRLLLSAPAVSSPGAAHAAEAAKRVKHHTAHTEHAAHPPKRLTPAQEINAQYALFSTAFAGVLNAYVQAINEQSTNTVAVTATVTATYTPPAGVIQVNTAAVFGPAGPFPSPVPAEALLGTVRLGTFSLTGSSGNYLIINPESPTNVELPVGTVLTASVPTSSQTSAASIFPITSSTPQFKWLPSW